MIRIISILSIAMVSITPELLVAQTTDGGATEAGKTPLPGLQASPSFVDDRPLPGKQIDAGAVARDNLLRQQRQQIQRLIENQKQNASAAADAAQKLKNIMALNAELKTRQTAIQAERDALLETKRRLIAQSNTEQTASADNNRTEQTKNIEQLEAQQLKLQAQLKALTQERDTARTALAAAQQAVHKEEATNRALITRLERVMKARREADQSQRAAQLANQNEEQKRRQLEAQLARQSAARRDAEQALSKAQITITTLTGKLKDQAASPALASTSGSAAAGSSNSAPSTASQPAVNAVALARRRALAEARRRAKAARNRANSNGAANN